MLTPSKRIQDTVFLNSAVMLERMGYYGYRSILSLFLIQGAFHMDKDQAAEWFTLLTVAIPFSRIIGGLCSDLLLGSKWSMLAGGIAQAAGIVLVSIAHDQFLLVGFVLLIAGNALFSPAVYARIGRSYLALPDKMDAAYTVNYCAVNLGAFLGPLMIGLIGNETSFKIGFGIAAGCMLISGLAALTLSNEEPLAKPESAPRTDISLIALLTGGVFLILTLYWMFYEMTNSGILPRVAIFDRSLNTNSSFLYMLAFTFVASVVLAIVWFFVKVNTFLKIGIGLLLSAAGALLFLQSDTPQDEQQLFMVYAVLTGIGEVLISPLLISVLVQYARPKYFGTLIGASSVFSWLLPTLFMKNKVEFYGIVGMQWIWVGAIGFLVMGIVTLILVLALKGSSRPGNRLV